MTEKLLHFGISKQKRQVERQLDMVEKLVVPEQDDIALDGLFSELMLIEGNIVGRVMSYLSGNALDHVIFEDNGWITLFNDKILRFKQDNYDNSYDGIQYENLLLYWNEVHNLYLKLKRLCLLNSQLKKNNMKEYPRYYIVREKIYGKSEKRPGFLSIKKSSIKELEGMYEAYYNMQGETDLTDILPNNMNLLVVSKKLLKIIQSIIPIKAFPIQINWESSNKYLHNYYVLIASELMDCLNIEKSMYHFLKNNENQQLNKIIIDSPFLKLEGIKNSSLFYQKEVIVNNKNYSIENFDVYANSQLKEKIEEAKCTGITFLEINAN